MTELIYGASIALGINIVMFIPAFIFKTDKLSDLSYGISFATVAIVLLVQSTLQPLHIVITIMVLLWSIRISAFLFKRIQKMKRDKRFDGIREHFLKFLGFWLLQGITVWVVLIPTILFLATPNVSNTWLTYCGICMWFAGLFIETIADYQKSSFIANPNNQGKWINTGLWKYSRHPNYFGEITHWTGIYVMTIPALAGVFILIGAASPVYIALLIIFVSGIPKLEAEADRRWGDNSEYQEYKKRTSVLVPLPPKSP